MCNQQFSSDFSNAGSVEGINAVFADHLLPGGKRGAKGPSAVAAATSTLLTSTNPPAPTRNVLMPDTTPMQLDKKTLLGM